MCPLDQELTFEWKRVKKAQSYVLEFQEALWGVPSSDSYPILIPAPASDTQTQSTSFEPTVPQNDLAVGYLWRVRAIGPEGLHGWAYPAQVYFIKPEPPVLISPYNPSSLDMPADGLGHCSGTR